MAKKEPTEYGKKFFEELLQLFPAEQQAAVKAIIDTLPEPVAKHAGEHILRQEDYSEQMNAVTTLRATTEQWRRDLGVYKTSVESALAEGEAAKTRLAALEGRKGGTINPDGSSGGADDGGGDNGKGGSVPDLTGYVKLDEVKKMVDTALATSQSYTTNYGAYMAHLAVSHSKEFDEVLDTGALINHCRDKNLQLDRGGYNDYVHEKRDAIQKKKHEDELKAAEEKGRRLALSESSSALPFPTATDGIGADGSQTLRGLEKGFDKGSAIARATETYNTEVRKRVSGAG